MTVLGCEWAIVWPQLNSNNYYITENGNALT